jgi:CBS domain-containing protein
MLLKQIIHTKGHDVHGIDPQASLDDVVQTLVENNCGSLVVCENGRLLGIITERDILRVTAAKVGALETLSVADFMTKDLITGTPDTDINQAMDLMTNNRIRHLPILENDNLVGIVSIGDMVKAHRHELTVENHHLMNYIQS